MDTTLIVTMILLTPLSGMWAFILSESRAADLSHEEIPDLNIDYQIEKAAHVGMLTPEQESA